MYPKGVPSVELEDFLSTSEFALIASVFDILLEISVLKSKLLAIDFFPYTGRSTVEFLGTMISSSNPGTNWSSTICKQLALSS